MGERQVGGLGVGVSAVVCGAVVVLASPEVVWGGGGDGGGWVEGGVLVVLGLTVVAAGSVVVASVLSVWGGIWLNHLPRVGCIGRGLVANSGHWLQDTLS